MKDNLSIVITMLIFVILIVIFPLYNYFERQDDMSYNLALKATTNFVDEVLEAGYLDQEMYNKYITEISNTGNIYDVQLEAHRKILIQDDPTDDSKYNEEYLINYNHNIFDESSGDVVSNIQDRVIKGNAYYFNEGDKFYVKMKNSNTTMAGAIFNTIVPTSSKDRIAVNYGGIIKNQAWAKVDATYRGHNASNQMIIKTDIPGYSEVTNSTGASIGTNTSIGGTNYRTVEFTPSYIGEVNWWDTLSKFDWKIEHNSVVIKTGNNYSLTDIFRHNFPESDDPYKITLKGKYDDGGETEEIFMVLKVANTIYSFSGNTLVIPISAIEGHYLNNYTFEVALDDSHWWGSDTIQIEGSNDGVNWTTIKSYTMPSFGGESTVGQANNCGGDTVTHASYTRGAFAVARVEGEVADNYTSIKLTYTVGSTHSHCIITNSNIKYSVNYKD